MGRDGGGGGGGGGSGSKEFCTFSCSPKVAVLAAIGFRGTLQINFNFSSELLVGFFLVNLVGNVKMH